MQRHYEAVILGGTLSATITAALLSKRGFRCLIVDQGELASTGGAMLPDLVLSEEGSLAMQLVHGELGIAHELRAKLRPFAASFQVIFPDQRIDLPPDRLGVVGEIKRVFGVAAAEATREAFARLDGNEREAGDFLAHSGPLPARGFFEKRSSSSLTRKHAAVAVPVSGSPLFEGVPDELGQLFVSLLPFVSHLDATSIDTTSVFRVVRPVARFLRGVHALAEGQSIRDLFVEQASKGTTEVLKSAVERITPSGKLIELEVSGEQATFTADTLVDASRDLSGLATLPAKQRTKNTALALQEAAPKGHLHAVSFEIDKDALPPGMAENLLLCNGRSRPRTEEGDDPDAEDRPILLLSRGSTVEAPHRARMIALHPLSSVRSHSQGVDRLDQVIRARIERLVPFLADGRPEIKNLTGTAPFLDHPLFDPELDPVLGICGVPTKTAHKHLFVGGPCVLPGLGVEGEYTTALQVADAIDTLTKGRKHPKTLAARKLEKLA